MKPPVNISNRWLPAALAVLLVGAATALAWLPREQAATVRGAWRELLRPGQVAIDASGRWLAGLRRPADDGDGNSPGSEELQALRRQVERLELALLLERSRTSAPPSDAAGAPSGVVAASYTEPTQPSPLVVADAVRARVLGRQAKALLVEREILAIGKSQSVRSDALVVDAIETETSDDMASAETSKPVIDQGAKGDVAADRLVLAGRRVWGRIAEVGPQTSTVRRVNDAGYRDLVQLASPREGRLQFNARGILAGSGERLCKIELVESTTPVAVGDLVFTADDGVLDRPLLYGRVTKLQRPSGAAHWEIWMEPAVARSQPPAEVDVLTIDVNPARAGP